MMKQHSENQYRPSTVPVSSDTLAIARFAQLVVHNIWIILVCLALIGLPAIIVASIMTPVYRAEILVAHVEDGTQAKGLGGISDQISQLVSVPGLSLGQGDSARNEAIAILLSRKLTAEFIVKANILQELFPTEWDADEKVWARENGNAPSIGEAIKVFDEDIRRLEEDLGTGLIRLSIEGSDRFQIADWANSLIDYANSTLRENAISEANRSLSFLHAELKKTTSIALKQAIFRLIEAQINKAMLANVRDQFAFKVLDPATAPEKDDFIRPNRPLIVALSLLASGILGILIIVIRQAYRQLSETEG